MVLSIWVGSNIANFGRIWMFFIMLICLISTSNTAKVRKHICTHMVTQTSRKYGVVSNVFVNLFPSVVNAHKCMTFGTIMFDIFQWFHAVRNPYAQLWNEQSHQTDQKNHHGHTPTVSSNPVFDLGMNYLATVSAVDRCGTGIELHSRTTTPSCYLQKFWAIWFLMLNSGVNCSTKYKSHS